MWLNICVETGGQREIGVGNIPVSTLKESMYLPFSSNREKNKFVFSPGRVFVKQEPPNILEEVQLTNEPSATQSITGKILQM